MNEHEDLIRSGKEDGRHNTKKDVFVNSFLAANCKLFKN